MTLTGFIKAKTAEIIEGLKAAAATIAGIDFKGHKHTDAEGRDTGGAKK